MCCGLIQVFWRGEFIIRSSSHICQGVVGSHPEPEKVIIFLHGSGITGFGMEKWLASLVKPYPGTVVGLPSAPMREYMLEGKRSSVWHQRKVVDIEAVDEDLVGIDEMCEGLHEMVESMCKQIFLHQLSWNLIELYFNLIKD